MSFWSAGRSKLSAEDMMAIMAPAVSEYQEMKMQIQALLKENKELKQRLKRVEVHCDLPPLAESDGTDNVIDAAEVVRGAPLPPPPRWVYVQLDSLMDSADKLVEIEGSLKERLGNIWSISHQEASNTMLGFRSASDAASGNEQPALKISCVKMLQRTEHCLEVLNGTLPHSPSNAASRPQHVLVIVRRDSTHEDLDRILQHYPRVANTFSRAFFLVQDPTSRGLNAGALNTKAIRELCSVMRPAIDGPMGGKKLDYTFISISRAVPGNRMIVTAENDIDVLGA